MNGNIVGNIDAAEFALWAFTLFFIALVFWLRREDRREGYPLEDELSGVPETVGGPLHTPPTKVFRLPFGQGTAKAPRRGPEPNEISARRTENFGGAPYAPVGNPLTAGVGPGGYAMRDAVPDRDAHGLPRIVPISAVPDVAVAKGGNDPRGLKVYGADGKVAGVVSELWVDRAEHIIRYLAVETASGAVLAPMAMAVIRRGHVEIDAINAADFAGAPKPAAAGEITRLEEERIIGYFGAGYLYANTDRQEPWL
jgi:photosynthetic reaction center H subunit